MTMMMIPNMTMTLNMTTTLNMVKTLNLATTMNVNQLIILVIPFANAVYLVPCIDKMLQ